MRLYYTGFLCAHSFTELHWGVASVAAERCIFFHLCLTCLIHKQSSIKCLQGECEIILSCLWGVLDLTFQLSILTTAQVFWYHFYPPFVHQQTAQEGQLLCDALCVSKKKHGRINFGMICFLVEFCDEKRKATGSVLSIEVFLLMVPMDCKLFVRSHCGS